MTECNDRFIPEKSMDDMTVDELITYLHMAEMCLPCSVCQGDVDRIEKEILRRLDESTK